jgi:hypothetical protein
LERAVWEAHSDDEGDTYYCNTVTGETSWDRPYEGTEESTEDVLDAAAQKRKAAFLNKVGQGIDEEKMRQAMMSDKEKQEHAATQAHEKAKSDMLKKQMQTFSSSKTGVKKKGKGSKTGEKKGTKKKKKKKKKAAPEVG